MPNRLARETSPYLLQHAGNPVDWYPWSEEAFKRAEAEDKPVLLSIGYSACHWCHVMAHESFENGEIARLMNENFINIKVDREERPDIDHIYMQAVQAMVGGGGWPLTVFLTPERKPFYGGTYFPPEDRQGMPGFSKILKSVIEAYHNRRTSIDNTTSQITEFLARSTKASDNVAALNKSMLEPAYISLEQCFDRLNGGFGGAPKFPNPLTLEFLLRYFTISGETQALEMVLLTLEKMAAGGIYDQIGGGFHRYSTDNKWRVPHFEKMLYDNALLSRVYLHAYLITGKKSLAAVAEETLDCILREMTGSHGGFFCSQDADIEGEEGKYYLWSEREMKVVLGESLFREVKDYYGVTEAGNFENRNILHRTHSPEEPAEIRDAKGLLLKHREQRTRPGRDEKVLTSWNGLMLSAMAEASAILRRRDYQSAAIDNGTFLRQIMISGDGKLMHSYKDGNLKIDGFLEDYANVIEAFLTLHEATLDVKWLESTIDLTRMMVEHFYDTKTGMLYDTPYEQKDLFVRPRNDFDGALPSGAATATLILLKMAVLTGNAAYREIAVRALNSVKENIGRTPLGYSQWACALDFHLSSPMEIAVVGSKVDPQTQSLAKVIYDKWLPNKVFAIFEPAGTGALKDLPLIKGRSMVNSKPTAYVCKNYVCKTPVTDVDKFRELFINV